MQYFSSVVSLVVINVCMIKTACGGQHIQATSIWSDKLQELHFMCRLQEEADSFRHLGRNTTVRSHDWEAAQWVT